MATIPIAKAVFERRGVKPSDLPPSSGELLPPDMAAEAQRAAPCSRTWARSRPGS